MKNLLICVSSAISGTVLIILLLKALGLHFDGIIGGVIGLTSGFVFALLANAYLTNSN